MSFGKRLYNIARAELKSAADKVKQSIAGEDVVEETFEREQDQEREEPVPTTTIIVETAEIRRYYANLELPIGASSAEVKAAYRRLMRRYHPDLHQADNEKAEVATRLAQELRVAYEGLIIYLEKRER